MKLLVINNVSSGYADGAIFDFLRIVSEDGTSHTIRSTDGTTPIKELLTDASDYDAVVVSGGDGTLSAAAYALANTGIPILPFPAGTANLLADNMCSPLEPPAIAALLKDMRTLDFDLGEIEAGDQKFGFAMIAGAGWDATIMSEAQDKKSLLGPMAYFRAAFTNTRPQKSKFKITLDGKQIESEGLGVIIVNFSKIQFDLTITHNNTPRDGLLDVVVLKAENAFGLLPALLAGLKDRDGEFPDRSNSLEIHSAKTITVEAEPNMMLQFDGEVPEASTPFTVRTLPGAARFIVSEAGFNEFHDRER